MKPDEVIYAKFWLRAPAVIIDGIIFGGLSLLILPLANYSFASYIVSTYLLAILTLAFKVFFLVKFGATPGKLVMKIKIVKTSFEPISYKEAFLRLSVNTLFIVLFLVAITIAFKSLSYETYRVMSFLEKGRYMVKFYPSWFNYNKILIILWNFGNLTSLLLNNKRRALHDFIAGTVVIDCKTMSENLKEQEEPKGKMGFHA